MGVDLIGDIECPNCGGTHSGFTTTRPCNGNCPVCGDAGHDRWDCPDRSAAGVDKSELGDDGCRAAELDPTVSVE
jgi:rubredoxin